jgi:hypothetical protein
MTEPVKGFRQLSVSLGAGAVPAVREALGHAAANPTHDPVLIVAVEDGGQRVSWRCGGDWGSPTVEIPACAAGGDL